MENMIAINIFTTENQEGYFFYKNKFNILLKKYGDMKKKALKKNYPSFFLTMFMKCKTSKGNIVKCYFLYVL